ncbi:molybdate/tungstate transport system substrate-binding protein [Granulicella rosea]|uniref:Molybdate/tungstate transport system substrate-binding protein n=1 Tax=Granulicella rosea TaxID=474952 RepID=A0A239ITM8_9BACT|nr:extracellular solute-binding protein [Granulicella rosea]SNS96947.1 molybdate/tungstate transport system substrate-binding protein [Granulicella rosea]
MSIATTRRDLLADSLALMAGGMATRLFAQELPMLEAASAGSFRAMLDGPLKTAAARKLGLNLRSHSQGADAVAKQIVTGALMADVFIPITAGPMETVMHAGFAETAVPVARTEMVIVYSPKSRFAAKLDKAAKGDGAWWEILQEPGFHLVRSNPAGDPGGRNIIFAMMLAAKKYGQPELVDRVLGPTLNPAQILTTGNNQDRLQSGEVDAMATYRMGAVASKMPYIVLPADVNLSGDRIHEEHPEILLAIDGKTFLPEPLVFYAAALRNAPNPKGAKAFVDWLQTAEAQAILLQNAFGAPGAAQPLRA